MDQIPRTDDSGIALRCLGIPTWRNSIGISKTRRDDSGIVPIPKLRGTYTLPFNHNRGILVGYSSYRELSRIFVQFFTWVR